MSIEAKKEEFSKYLLESKVVDDITEALISLYEEDKKTNNPTEYIKAHLKSDNENERILADENDRLQEENRRLNKEIQELKKKLEKLQKSAESS